MSQPTISPLGRRAFLHAAGLGTAAFALGCRQSTSAGSQASAYPEQPAPTTAPAPAPSPIHQANPVVGVDPAKASCQVTASNIEGPFFKPGAPSRSNLTTGQDGQPLIVRGRVFDTRCRPIAGAHLDIWQADHEGAYDNSGFQLRGAQVSRGDGVYELRTIHPGHYLNGPRYRPAHIHVKVSAPGYAPLTTQLYFEGDPYNEGDPFIDRSLIMKVAEDYGAQASEFDFVLRS